MRVQNKCCKTVQQADGFETVSKHMSKSLPRDIKNISGGDGCLEGHDEQKRLHLALNVWFKTWSLTVITMTKAEVLNVKYDV